MSALMWLGAALACMSVALAVWTATSPAGLSLARGLLGRFRVRMEGLGRGGVALKGPPGASSLVKGLFSRFGKATRAGMRRGGPCKGARQKPLPRRAT